MDKDIFKKETFTYDDIEEAVNYGINYGTDEDLTISESNIQQWLATTKLRSADNWQKLNPDIVVIDPDGWDKKNHKKNWYEELITYQEYVQRREQSSCMFKNKKYENN